MKTSITMLNLLAIALVAGTIGATVFISCTATQARQATATGVVAAFDCEGAHFDGAVLDDLKAAARAKVDAWISGKAPADMGALIDKVKADLGAFRSDAGRCALAAVLAAATTIVSPTPGEATSALTATGPDPVAVRAAFATAARELGWVPVKVAGGAIL